MGFWARRESLWRVAIADAFPGVQIFGRKNPQCGTVFALLLPLDCALRVRIGALVSLFCELLFRSQNPHGRGMIACELTQRHIDSLSVERVRF
jgi:hypothetical protein